VTRLVVFSSSSA